MTDFPSYGDVLARLRAMRIVPVITIDDPDDAIPLARALMANRDGVKLYDWNSLTDRRSGYSWYTVAPAHTLATFEQWSRSHPRP